MVRCIGRSTTQVKCRRSRWNDGSIFEMVMLNGSDEPSEAEYRLIEALPVDDKEYTIRDTGGIS